MKCVATAALLLNLLLPASAHCACGDSEKATPFYQAYVKCDQLRAALAANQAFDELRTRFENTGYCSLVTDKGTDDSLLNEVCQDPSAFVCGMNEAQVFDHQCRKINIFSDKSGLTPGAVEMKCSLANFRDKLAKAHQGECGARPPNECSEFLKLKYVEEMNAEAVRLTYTPERVERLRKIFDQVKETYLARITDSRRIPDARKAELKAALEETKLASPDELLHGGWGCVDHALSNPSLQFSYEPLETGPRMFVCLGAVADLESYSDADLLVTFGHELSHAIDPCVLQTRKAARHEPMPSMEDYFPGLIACLRGGKGADGCKDPIYPCQSAADIRLKCQRAFPGKESAELIQVRNQCIDYGSKTPACSMFSSDYDDPISGDPHPPRYKDLKNDPIPEAFADFMGAEIAGTVLGMDTPFSLHSKTERVDALVNIAADFNGDYLRCKQTGRGVHPPGYLRVSRNIMGSESFRRAFCEGYRFEPKARGGGVSCVAF